MLFYYHVNQLLYRTQVAQVQHANVSLVGCGVLYVVLDPFNKLREKKGCRDQGWHARKKVYLPCRHRQDDIAEGQDSIKKNRSMDMKNMKGGGKGGDMMMCK